MFLPPKPLNSQKNLKSHFKYLIKWQAFQRELFAKDIILAVIGKIGHGRRNRFCSGICRLCSKKMSMEQRMNTYVI